MDLTEIFPTSFIESLPIDPFIHIQTAYPSQDLELIPGCTGHKAVIPHEWDTYLMELAERHT